MRIHLIDLTISRIIWTVNHDVVHNRYSYVVQSFVYKGAVVHAAGYVPTRTYNFRIKTDDVRQLIFPSCLRAFIRYDYNLRVPIEPYT